VTDEQPFDDFTNWADGEPNDHESQNYKEDALQLWNRDDTWNDMRREVKLQGFVVEFEDSDGDLIPDPFDECPYSDLASNVIIDGCDSGVANRLLDGGCTVSDIIANASLGAKNHGAFVSAVSKLTNELKSAKLISNREKGKLQSCAAQAQIP